MQNPEVSEKISLIKGFSIFNPSENTLKNIKENFKIKFENLSDEEKVLWVGSTDFRYSLISFGPSIFHFLIISCVSLLLYISIYNKNENLIYIWEIFLATIFLLLFMIFSIARRFFGLVYALTETRLCIFYAYKVQEFNSFLFNNSINRRFDGFLSYDLRILTHIDCIKLLFGDVGSILIWRSVREFPPGKIMVRDTGYDYPVKISIKKRIIMQNLDFRKSTCSNLVSLRDFSKLISKVDELRSFRNSDLDQK